MTASVFILRDLIYVDIECVRSILEYIGMNDIVSYTVCANNAFKELLPIGKYSQHYLLYDVQCPLFSDTKDDLLLPFSKILTHFSVFQKMVYHCA